MKNADITSRRVAAHTLYQPGWAVGRLIGEVDRTVERCFGALSRKHMPPHHDFEHFGNTLAQTRDVICSAVRARFHPSPGNLFSARIQGESWNYCENRIMATLADMKKGVPAR